MRPETLDILRCPYCGGRLEMVTSSFHRCEGDEILDGILGCHCCVFPVVSGIPVLHLEPAAVAARAFMENGEPALAARRMFALDDDRQAARFEEAAASPASTYRDLVEALGPAFEGGYFLYRFSDPTYVVADALVGALASVLGGGRMRSIDICGGSGHLTRSLLGSSTLPPLVADLYFAKLWLARRFAAPGCEAICCDANAPLPFATKTFQLVVCSDAFHYIWTKRLLASEMVRITTDPGAVAVTHAHNANEWNPSAGMPLPPDGYRQLFEDIDVRLFAERELLREIVAGGPLDLSRRHSDDVIGADVALTIIASRRPEVFGAYPPRFSSRARGEFRLNPLYTVDTDGDTVRLRLQFPSADYEEEYGAARMYLPYSVALERSILAALPAERLPGDLAELARRRVILDLPKRYC
jgi:uncharacterized protein YbaR (Trm112 family)/SAM-dependent methyltransferase